MNDLVRKFLAILLGVGTATVMLVMYNYGSVRWLFFLMFFLWVCVLTGASWFFQGLWRAIGRHLPLALTTFAACVGLMTLVEWKEWVFLIIVLAGFFITLLFGWTVRDNAAVGTVEKPFRRMKMMLWVFNAYALVTTGFAINVFFPRLPFWILHLLMGLMFMFVSFMIWRMYYVAPLRATLQWLLIVGLLMMELVWVLQLLPLGYLASGLCAAWVWYLVQLFVRFHFAEQGIVWQRQKWFLITNAVLIILFLVLARWTPNTR